MRPEKIKPQLLESYKTQAGKTLGELSNERPLLLVFLRHFGCTFCREAVAEITELHKDIEAKGTQLAFVHLSDDDEKAQNVFAPHGLQDVPRLPTPTASCSNLLASFAPTGVRI